MESFLIWVIFGPLVVGVAITALALVSTPFIMFWEKIKGK